MSFILVYTIPITYTMGISERLGPVSSRGQRTQLSLVLIGPLCVVRRAFCVVSLFSEAVFELRFLQQGWADLWDLQGEFSKLTCIFSLGLSPPELDMFRGAWFEMTCNLRLFIEISIFWFGILMLGVYICLYGHFLNYIDSWLLVTHDMTLGLFVAFPIFDICKDF